MTQTTDPEHQPPPMVAPPGHVREGAPLRESAPPGRAREGTPAVRAPRVHRAWWVAAVASLAIISAGAFTTMSGLLVSPLHQEFHWSRGTIGFAASVNMALYGLTAPFAAALMDRLGIRRVVVGALLTIAAGAALTTVMTQAWQLTLYWGVLVGLGCGSVAMAFAATVSGRWFARRRGLVAGFLTAAGVFGQFVFLPLLSWIVDRYAWRPAAVTPALAALVVVPFVLLLLRDHPADIGLKAYGAEQFTPKPAPLPGAARRTLRVLREAAGTLPFWLLAGTFAICGASTNGVMWTAFAPAAHDHGMPVTVAASLLAMIGVFNVVGTIASGWLTDRFDARRLLAVYYALRGISLMSVPLLLAATVQPSMITFIVIFGLLDVATVPPTIALCREFHGEDSAIVFGWVSAAHQVGAALVAFLGGVARDAFGSYDMLWFAAGALCAPAALMALMVRSRKSGSV
ncbi:MFS transporter [Streptomyces sp. NPDC004647]|uniref:MFS transporter n=1 Tax=Streptomyces sp. NPDC004647 TaxID=3154671 RepID=UPI00339E05C0